MASGHSFRDIEEKWIDKWEQEGVFEVNKEDKDPFFVNVAYPYPSGSMHVGHGRTYTLPDIVARYKRMNGFNVLFPMAWHVTGTPVIGISRRLREEDEETIDIYKNLYGVPEEKLSDFTDPLKIVEYFSEEYKDVMSRMGYSIDWRREFRTVDDEYNEFIGWQYRNLKEKGLIKRGTHPVKYCPNDENALGDHDLLEGEEADIDDFYLIKFRLKNKEKDVFLPCATLRPETVFGVTNLWMKPEGEYVEIKTEGEENWITSKEAVKKLSEQGWSPQVIEEMKGNELIGEEVISPFNDEVPILEASFVDLDVATGVVMSVPAHAPYDLIALKDLDKDIDPIKVIDSERYGKTPSNEVLKKYGINDQSDVALEDATEELYNKEFSKGKMRANIEEYGGMEVRLARDEIGNDLVREKKAEKMFEFNQQPVVCRCGEQAIVKVLEDQWFLDYSDPEWKEKTKKGLSKLDLIPSDIRKDFNHSIDWLEEWACTRRVGLGTNLPWDQEWIIEPLSDSTIYMSYYTIADTLKEVEGDISDEVFDYLFLDEGTPEEVSAETGIEEQKIREMKEEFIYWYPYNFRFSAKDLIPNHLTFQLFHHTALFNEKDWPRGISVLGMGLLEGEKMSSSKGHVVLLEEALDKYGADTVRFFLAENAEPWQDFDWREEDVKSTHNKLMHFWNKLEKFLSYEEPEKDLDKIDNWLLSKFNKRIKETRKALEKHQTRKALQNSFYLIRKDLSWYKRRTNLGREGAKWTLKNIAKKWIKLLAPFIPFIAEEIWSETHDSFISTSKYPTPKKELFNEKIEFFEEILKEINEDIKEILKVTEQDPNRIYLYTPTTWKKSLFKKILETETNERSKIMSKIMSEDKYRKKGEKINKILGDLIKIKRELSPNIEHYKDLDLEKELIKTKDFLEKEFNAKIEIQSEEKSSHDPKNKSDNALPLKPAIYIE